MGTEMSISQPEAATASRSWIAWMRAHRVEVVSGLVLALLVGLTSGYTAWRMFTYGNFDYGYHVGTALEMKDQRSIELPHFLYHLYVILLSVILPGLSEYDLAMVSIVTLRIAGALAVFWLISRALPRPLTLRGGLALAGIAFMLVIVTAITVPTWPDGQFYLGYIGLNAFHNPTLLALVPLALPTAWLTTRITFSDPERPGLARDTALSALLIVLSTLAKPSYLLCLLPAVGMLSLWRLIRRERLPWRALILGLALPGVILLAWQYVFTYGGGSTSDSLSESSIEFAPFKVMVWLSNDHNISGLFLLSIAFPALVYVLFFPETFKDRFFTLSAVAAVFGASYAYLLAEGGDRTGDGNFIWSAEITLFIWFVAAMRFLIRRNRPTIFGRDAWTRARTVVVLAVFGLHLVSGALFELRGAVLNTGYTNLPSGGYYDDPPASTSDHP
jgi:hypothetical protein